jgi:ribosomal protein S18 acetylase RimI-like enzyme
VSAGAESRVLVRSCRSDELAQVLELWRTSRDWTAKTDERAGLAALVKRDREALLVAELDGRLVGSLIAAWDGWRGNMYRLTVDPTWRRRGIAGRRITAAEQRLRALGARRISAIVWGRDDPAVRTWLSAGYEHDKGTERFVKTIPQ